MGFTKLDEGILRSSIMAEDPATFKVWIAFLAACEPDGVARVSAVFMSSVCRLGLPTVHKAIERLESPDADSRSEAHEGRRILKVDGGWFIVNYEKYRAFKYSEEPDAKRKREYRQRKREGVERDMSGTCPGHSASASASASDISSKSKKDKSPKIILILDEEPKRWEGITEEDKALWAKTYPGCNIGQVLQEMIAYWDAQPRSHLKLNWKRTIVNRLKWIQDHGGIGTRIPIRALPGSVAPGTWLRKMKEKQRTK